METKRTEWMSINVTPEVKKEFELAKDNKTLQESIIRSFIKDETDWLTDELKEADEANLRYKCKLVEIKDNFTKSQDAYVEEIEEIVGKADRSFKKLDILTEKLQTKTEKAYNDVARLSEKITYINIDRLERLLLVIEKYNKMTDTEKEMIKLIINKK